MALDKTSLTRRDLLGRVGNGPGSVRFAWGYVTSDPIATFKAGGYFTDPATSFVIGDIIDCVSSAGGTPAYTALVVTTVTMSGIVTVS